MRKVVYSGDCLPSQPLARAGRGCDLLIHEATFDDSRSADAARKRHCTTGQAAQVGAMMGAKLTVLTHFSQRYASAPTSSKSSSSSSSSSSSQCAVAFDFLSFSLPAQGAALPSVTAALAAVLEGLHRSAAKAKAKDKARGKSKGGGEG